MRPTAIPVTTLKQSGGVSIANTVAPSHDYEAPLTPIIGTQITGVAGEWTGNPTITHQWQKALTDAGPWSDVSGATSINYTPLTADNVFGYVLRRLEIPNGDTDAAAASAATAAVAEVPSQTLGAELLANGSFAAWSGGAPNSWLHFAGTAGADPGASQVAPDGSAGTGAAKLTSSATANSPRIGQIVMSAGTYYESAYQVTDFVSGQVRTTLDTALDLFAAELDVRAIGRASGGGFEIRANGAAPHDFTVDNVSVKAITLNAQLTAPSADMLIDFAYTLPGTPRGGDAIWLMPRISDFSSGNYWVAILRYTGSQWDLSLYSAASHTRTSRIGPATNIGATVGLRINANGNSWSLYSTADGDNYTQHGSTITNSTYATATGVNVLYTSGITPGVLTFAAPF